MLSVVNKFSRNSRLLFFIHLPGVIHGSSVLGKLIHESGSINEAFNIEYINILNNKAKSKYVQIKDYLRIIILQLRAVFLSKYSLVYYPISLNGISFYRDIMILMLFKIKSVKVILHFHHKRNRSNWLYRVLCKAILGGFYGIILNERLSCEVPFIHADRLFICPNGIPSFSPMRSREVSSEVNVRFLFFSRISEEKGVFHLLQTLVLLKQRSVQFHCTIAGDGTEDNIALLKHEILSGGLSACVEYIGPQYGAAKQRVFCSHDILVLPTLNETFGLVIVEAFSTGMPVISTMQGAIPDLIGDSVCGTLLERHHPEELYQAMLYYINNKKEISIRGEAGYKKYQQCYSLPQFENNFISIIKEVIGEE